MHYTPPSSANSVPPFTINDPGHLKSVNDWVKGDLAIGNAATPGMTAVIGIVTAVTDVDNYIVQTSGHYLNAVVAAIGNPGDILYLQNDGSMGTTQGTYEKAVGIRISGGMSVDASIMGIGYVPIQNNYSASAAPIVTDDSASGYAAGSKWYWDDAGDQEVWMCMDASLGAAVWLLATLTLDDLGTMATQNSDSVTITGGTISGLTSISALTFDTNVAAAGVTLSGTTLSADGTDSNISITITPKGTGTIALNGGISGSSFINDDTMATATVTSVASSASIKAYVDTVSVVNMAASYTGTDAPGTGSNILTAGQSRVWNNATTGKSYFLTNYSTSYRAVELTGV